MRARPETTEPELSTFAGHAGKPPPGFRDPRRSSFARHSRISVDGSSRFANLLASPGYKMPGLDGFPFRGPPRERPAGCAVRRGSGQWPRRSKPRRASHRADQGHSRSFREQSQAHSRPTKPRPLRNIVVSGHTRCEQQPKEVGTQVKQAEPGSAHRANRSFVRRAFGLSPHPAGMVAVTAELAAATCRRYPSRRSGSRRSCREGSRRSDPSASPGRKD